MKLDRVSGVIGSYPNHGGWPNDNGLVCKEYSIHTNSPNRRIRGIHPAALQARGQKHVEWTGQKSETPRKRLPQSTFGHWIEKNAAESQLSHTNRHLNAAEQGLARAPERCLTHSRPTSLPSYQPTMAYQACSIRLTVQNNYKKKKKRTVSRHPVISRCLKVLIAVVIVGQDRDDLTVRFVGRWVIVIAPAQ
jgi:hypothetical protein